MSAIDLDTTEHDEKVAVLAARVEELRGLLVETLTAIDVGECLYYEKHGPPRRPLLSRLRAALEGR